MRGLLRLPRIRLRFRIVRVQEAADYRGRGYCLMQRFELFGHDRAGKGGDARNVAARSVEACDETEFDWIAGNRKKDRSRCGRFLGRKQRSRTTDCDDHRRMAAKKIG